MNDGVAQYKVGIETGEWPNTTSGGLYVQHPFAVFADKGSHDSVYHYDDNRIGLFWYKDGVMAGEQCIPSDTIAGLLANHPSISEYYTTGSQ